MLSNEYIRHRACSLRRFCNWDTYYPKLLITGLKWFQSGGFTLSAKRVEIKSEQTPFYNEGIRSYSGSSHQTELLGKCSMLPLLAQGWRFCLRESFQHESFGIKFLINSESPTAVSNYHTSISIHVQTALLLKLQSSC